MKKGNWVFDGCQSFGRIVNKPYEFSGVLHIDVALYNRDGERIGRESPACGGPTSFEPACTAEGWVVIEEPDFPISKRCYLADVLTPSES